jgi:DNA ligase-associated metallophosphoesterase
MIGGMDSGSEPDGSKQMDHEFHWHGAGALLTLRLTPERAVHWPAESTLFIADVHVGKAAVFRARGLPVPRGTTSATLSRLSRVVARTGARKLVVLGDFLHARESHAEGTMAALQAWRASHPELTCVIVQGNHDRHAGALSAASGFLVQHEPYVSGALIGVHEPHEAERARQACAPDTPLVLAGHVHPVFSLRDRLDSLRLPCYAWRDGVMTLPAFGDFTGGYEVDRRTSRIFLVGDAPWRSGPAPAHGVARQIKCQLIQQLTHRSGLALGIVRRG